MGRMWKLGGRRELGGDDGESARGRWRGGGVIEEAGRIQKGKRVGRGRTRGSKLFCYAMVLEERLERELEGARGFTSKGN